MIVRLNVKCIKATKQGRLEQKLEEKFIIKYKFFNLQWFAHCSLYNTCRDIKRMDNDKIVVLNHKKEVVATILNFSIKRN